jgi:chromosome segregation ATPase
MDENSKMASAKDMEHSSDLKAAFDILWQSVKAAADTISAFRADNAALSQKLSDLERRIEEEKRLEFDYKEKIALLDAEKQEYERLRTELTNDFEIKKAQFESLDEIIVKNSKLKEDFEHLQNEFVVISEKLQASETALEELSRSRETAGILKIENEKLRNRLAELSEMEKNSTFSQNEIARKNREINAKLDEIDALKNRIAELQSKQFENDSERNKCNGRIDALERSIFSMLERHVYPQKHEQDLDFDDDTNLFKEEISAAAAIEKIEEFIKDAKLALAQKDEVITGLKNELTALDAARQNIESAEAHNADLKQIIAQLNDRIQDQSGSLIKLQGDLNYKDRIIEEYSETITALEFDTDELKSEISRLKEVITNLEQTNSELRVSLDTWNEKAKEISLLKAKIEHFEDEKQQYIQNEALNIQRLDELTNALSEEKAQNERNLHLLSQIPALKQSIEDYKRNNEILENEKRQLHLQIESLTAKASFSAQQFEEQKEQIAALNNAHNALVDEKLRLIAEIDRMKKLEEILPTKDKIIQEFSEQIEQLTALKLASDISAANSREEINKLTETANFMRDEIESLKTHISNLQEKSKISEESEKQLTRLNEKLAMADEKISELENRLQVELNTKLVFEKTLQDTRNLLSLKETQLTELLCNYDSLKQERDRLSELLSDTEKTKAELALTRKANESLNQQFENAKLEHERQLASLESRLLASAKEINALSQTTADLETELDMLRQSLKESENEIIRLRQEIRNKEKKYEELFERKDEIVDKLDLFIGKINEKLV